jgi:hypothetical protein
VVPVVLLVGFFGDGDISLPIPDRPSVIQRSTATKYLEEGWGPASVVRERTRYE